MRSLRIIQWNGAKVWAGAEVRMVEACRHLAARGHTVTAVARGGAPLFGHLVEAGVPASGVAPHGAADLPRILRTAWLARRVRADVIHAHAGRDYAPAVAAARLAGRPLVLHRHLALPLKSSTRKLVLSGAAAVIAVSSPVEQALVAQDGFPAERVHRVPMLVDPDRPAASPEDAARARREMGAENRPLIVSVGHLHRSKGHDILIQAAARLHDAGHDLIIAIAGDGPERGWLEAQVRQHHLERTVHLLGARDDVPALLGACDCFALLSWEDPFPGAILEATAAGKPVVACAAGGVPEMVADGETGILVAPHDPEAASQALARLLADPDLAGRMGERGDRRARTEFSYDSMLEQWEDVYAGVLAARPARR